MTLEQQTLLGYLRQQRQILLNTLRSGEANEKACNRSLDKIEAKIAEMERDGDARG